MISITPLILMNYLHYRPRIGVKLALDTHLQFLQSVYKLMVVIFLFTR